MPPTSDHAEATIPAASGGVVQTGAGATASDVVVTKITVPAGAAPSDFLLTINESPATGAPAGFTAFGQQVVIDGGGVTFTSPVTIEFDFDASVVGGTLPANVQIFRNGVLVPDCSGPGDAGPCVVSRAFIGGGDIAVIVRTTVFSTWLAATKNTAPTCLTVHQKLQLIRGILEHWKARRGHRNYNPRFDLNSDGVINHKDILVVLRTPTCRQHHRHDDDD